MNLSLTRISFRSDGIFSKLTTASGAELAVTLEHAFPSVDGTCWTPKIPNGVYTCKRGMHQLPNGAPPFETFEITGVAGHTGLLFHIGNKNADSEGCVLPGSMISTQPDGSKWVMNSGLTFSSLMRVQADCNEFQLTVA